MAVPSYTTDLVDIADMDSSGGSAVEPATLYTAGRGPEEADTDMPIQGTKHASLTLNATGNGGIFVPGDTFTYTAGDYIFGWLKWTAPSTIDTYANGGMSILLGSSASVFNVYYVSGSDRAPNPYGGWQNVAVLPTMTPSENAGTPTAYHYVGAAVKCIIKVAKGNPLAFDVFRYGRGETRIAGGQTGNYATFAGFAAVNDNNSNRWGLFQLIEGGFKFKGKIYLGYGSLTEFTDSNVAIVIEDTEWVSADFNKIEVHNASSVINWTNIGFTALGTVSKGQFVAVDNATINKTACTFTDMDSFTYQSNSTIINTTYRRCGLITQGGATFTNDIITNATGTVAMAVSSMSDVDGCTFESDGTGHAIDLGNITTDTSITFNCSTTGYASSNGSTGNEVILVNVSSGQTLTINVSGVTSPTYKNTGSGTVTVVNAVALTIEAQVTLVGAEVRIYDYNGGAHNFGDALAGIESNTTSTFIYSGASSNVIYIQIMKDGYEEFGQVYTMPSVATTLTVKLQIEENL